MDKCFTQITLHSNNNNNDMLLNDYEKLSFNALLVFLKGIKS